MAIQTIPGRLLLPPMVTQVSGVSFTQVATLIADTALAAFVVQAPKTGNIRKVRVGTRTITTGGTADVRLETVDATTGHPSGTLWGTTTNGSWVIANGDDNVFVTTTLTADAAVVAGDTLAVCVKVATGFSGQMLAALALNAGADSHFPYFRFFNGTSWAGTGSGYPMLMFEYDDGSYATPAGCFPAGALTAAAPSTATTPDVWAARFQLPWPARVIGCEVVVGATGDTAIRLVEASYHQGNQTGILADFVIDDDVMDQAATALHRIIFDTPATLAANTWYRLIVEPVTATAGAGPHDIEVPSLAALDGWVSQNWHLSSAKDPTGDGSWTNFNSGTFRAPIFMSLLIDGFDDAVAPASGGISRGRVQLGM